MDIDRIFQGLGDLVRQNRAPTFCDALRDLLVPLFAAESVIVLIFENRRRPKSVYQWIPDRRLHAYFEASYFEFGYFMDPFYELAIAGFDDGGFRLRDIAPDRFFRSAYYRRYFQETRMVDELGYLARMNDKHVAHLSLGRSEGSPRYRQREVALAKSLAPVLTPLMTEHCRHRLSHGALAQSRRPQRPLKERLFYTKLPDGLRISAREAEVASLVIQGHSTVAIAMILEISPQTVKVHRRNVYRKLKISSQAELFALFSR